MGSRAQIKRLALHRRREAPQRREGKMRAGTGSSQMETDGIQRIPSAEFLFSLGEKEANFCLKVKTW